MPWPPADGRPAVRRRRAATTRTKWSCRRGGARGRVGHGLDRGRSRSSATVAHHLAQGGAGEQLEATPATTPGCRAGRTPGIASTVPNAKGLAGRMAICIQRMSPRSSTTFTKSKSPMLTPPLVTRASHRRGAPRMAAATASRRRERARGRRPRTRLAPERAERMAVGVPDLARRSGARRTSSSPVESTPTRGASHDHGLGHADAGQHADVGGGQHRARRRSTTSPAGRRRRQGGCGCPAAPRPRRARGRHRPASGRLDHHDGVGAAGIGAPVMIRTAWPGPTRDRARRPRPAWRRRRATGAPAVSAARTA